ncbi:LacI family DNA-binding transcriptional regulator, partial [Streptomyces albidoflavus]|uniref:LacI family DNA-binding transcriptional regulator n=1 Tax=Streptomyces albidoflavus TaxID=1886 RepID=UPI0033BBA4E4
MQCHDRPHARVLSRAGAEDPSARGASGGGVGIRILWPLAGAGCWVLGAGGARRGRGENMAITSHDVARLAGVSQPTVSRALRDDPRVSRATREKVRRAAALLA